MNVEQILLVAAVVIYLIVKRFAGSPVGSRSLLMPLILVGWGLVELTGKGHHGLGTLNTVLLAVEALIGVAAGAARASTIKLYVRDGHLWQRYSMITLAVWIGMIAIRIGMVAAGHAVGASLPEGGTAMVTFGLSMVVESLLVAKRAATTGAPILPRQTRQSRRSGVGIR